MLVEEEKRGCLNLEMVRVFCQLLPFSGCNGGWWVGETWHRRGTKAVLAAGDLEGERTSERARENTELGRPEIKTDPQA